MYTVELANGTKLEHLELNGNNYVSDSIVEDAVFEGNLSKVVITDEDTQEKQTLKDAVLVQNVSYDGVHSYFILGERSEEEKTTTDIQEALAELYEMLLGGL